MVQNTSELETWYERSDPWSYETTPDDLNRRAVLLAELPPQMSEGRVLDIGCGEGFITHHLPGKEIVGVDISSVAIERARQTAPSNMTFDTASLFELSPVQFGTFDVIVITGVLYDQYIGRSASLVNLIIDQLLAPGGALVSVHIAEWYKPRFPYLRLKQIFYQYREYTHVLEVYRK